MSNLPENKDKSPASLAFWLENGTKLLGALGFLMLGYAVLYNYAFFEVVGLQFMKFMTLSDYIASVLDVIVLEACAGIEIIILLELYASDMKVETSRAKPSRLKLYIARTIAKGGLIRAAIIGTLILITMALFICVIYIILILSSSILYILLLLLMWLCLYSWAVVILGSSSYELFTIHRSELSASNILKILALLSIGIANVYFARTEAHNPISPISTIIIEGKPHSYPIYGQILRYIEKGIIVRDSRNRNIVFVANKNIIRIDSPILEEPPSQICRKLNLFCPETPNPPPPPPGNSSDVFRT